MLNAMRQIYTLASHALPAQAASSSTRVHGSIYIVTPSLHQCITTRAGAPPGGGRLRRGFSATGWTRRRSPQGSQRPGATGVHAILAGQSFSSEYVSSVFTSPSSSKVSACSLRAPLTSSSTHTHMFLVRARAGVVPTAREAIVCRCDAQGGGRGACGRASLGADVHLTDLHSSALVHAADRRRRALGDSPGAELRESGGAAARARLVELLRGRGEQSEQGERVG